eukprot:Rhum_TRINITY_DN14766_c10_g1::Rhum_TRINITY_DN14766_c10_g1_i1::g.115095::m.115095
MLVRRVLHGAAAPAQRQLRFKRSEAVADARRMSQKIPVGSKGTMGMTQEKLQEVVPEVFPDGTVDPSHRTKALEAMKAAVSKVNKGATKVEPAKIASVKAKAEPVKAEPAKGELPASFTNAFTTIFKKISETKTSNASTESKPPTVEAAIAASRRLAAEAGVKESTAPPVGIRHPFPRVVQTPQKAEQTPRPTPTPTPAPRPTPTPTQKDAPSTEGGGSGGGLAAAFLKVKADLEEKVQTLESKLKLLSSTPAPSAGVPLPTALQYEVMKASAQDTEVALAVESVEEREFIGCINRVDIAGIMGRPSTKLWQTGIVTEFTITTTQQRMEMKGGGLLTEREMHKVYVHGATIARFIMSNARQGYLVHVQGRLTGFPRWSEDEGKMVHSHAINVHPESGGNFTILRGAVANQDAVFNSLEYQATVKATADRKKERSGADKKAAARAVQEAEVQTRKAAKLSEAERKRVAQKAKELKDIEKKKAKKLAKQKKHAEQLVAQQLKKEKKKKKAKRNGN